MEQIKHESPTFENLRLSRRGVIGGLTALSVGMSASSSLAAVSEPENRLASMITNYWRLHDRTNQLEVECTRLENCRTLQEPAVVVGVFSECQSDDIKRYWPILAHSVQEIGTFIEENYNPFIHQSRYAFERHFDPIRARLISELAPLREAFDAETNALGIERALSAHIAAEDSKNWARSEIFAYLPWTVAEYMMRDGFVRDVVKAEGEMIDGEMREIFGEAKV